MQKLSAKQEQFCREYLVDLNATQAAIRAGYSPKTAYSMGQRLLKNVEVQKAVQSAMDERSKRVEIDADYVLKNLVEVVERCMQRAPVMHKGEQVVDDEGNSLWLFDGKVAVRALELLGKHKGMFTDKVQQEVSGPNGGAVQGELTIKLVRPGHADS